MRVNRIMTLSGLTVIAVLLSTCTKKQLPPDNLAKPVFYLQGILDNDSLGVVAGDEGYYMSTSYLQGIDGVYLYKGSFTKNGCFDCPETWSISVRGEKSYTQQAFGPVENAIFPAVYTYQNIPGILSPNTFQFNSLATGSGTMQYHWDFGDGNYSTDANPIHTYSTASIYNVCLAIADGVGCVDTVCNLIRPSSPANYCASGFTYNQLPGIFGFEFFANPAGQGPFNYYWDFGNGVWSNQANPVQFYNTAGIYKVCLTITSATQCQSVYCMQINTNPISSSCLANFGIQAGVDSLQFSTIEINYWDKTGNKYSSMKVGGQPSNSSFTIDKTEDYLDNESNQKTKKISGRINCVLYNTANPLDSLVLKETKTVFGVSYPD